MKSFRAVQFAQQTKVEMTEGRAGAAPSPDSLPSTHHALSKEAEKKITTLLTGMVPKGKNFVNSSSIASNNLGRNQQSKLLVAVAAGAVLDANASTSTVERFAERFCGTVRLGENQRHRQFHMTLGVR